MADTVHFEQLYRDNINRELKKLELIKDPSKRAFHILSLKGINEIFFLYTSFIKEDVQMSKLYLYKIGMTHSFFYEKLQGEVFEALDTFTYPILSDSPALINRYLSYENTQHPHSFSAHFGKAIQSVLKENQDTLRDNIKGLNTWSKKGWAKNFVGIETAFVGFLNSDKSKIEEGLKEILSLHDKQEHPAIAKDYINLEATTLAKLAWRKGIEVQVDNNLIPVELLPVKELPNYDDYDFFKEL